MEMDSNLIVLRRVQNLSDATLEEVAVKESDMPYFPDYVDNDLARDGAYTYELVDKTLGFALAGEDGEVLKKFKTLEEAEQARRSARVTFEVKVDVDGTDNIDSIGS